MMNPDELADLRSVLQDLSDTEVRRRYNRADRDSEEAELYGDEIKRRNLFD